MAKQRHQEPVRITTAASNRADDIRTRQRRYLFSMSLRTVCFVGAIVAALNGIAWLWPILIAAALILPYIAVVMANAVAKSDAVDLPPGAFNARELGGQPNPWSTGADRHESGGARP
ncbi:DUF3099 domain-containing protein [Nocardioides mangrovi]|uniref:DUF3099 domain-containing protein n=1 Tax=Nocardioides mangrovi TaxID=2874580 RepID=A0ABS7UG11_9ACTN|nr:DUF3099 domain-containing protein [Nocardioides mangrovi]MBZ5739954.1 DUF3099 domain-containing protein [Nocardioides mangrovi]